MNPLKHARSHTQCAIVQAHSANASNATSSASVLQVSSNLLCARTRVLTVNLSIAEVLEQRQSASLHALWPSLLREALVSLPSGYSMLLLCCICLQDGVSLHHGSAVDTVVPLCCVCACLSKTIIRAISTSFLREIANGNSFLPRLRARQLAIWLMT
jgi:hypothetical protein